jgi:hypothetical protein
MNPIADGSVSDDVLARVKDAVSGMVNLGHVLSWGAAATPPRKPEDVVAQDEYTHDVVMLFEDGIYTVYDVT